MRLHLKMPERLKPYYQQEIQQSDMLLAAAKLAEAWRHLERAHILGQAYPFEHSHAHWKMLQFGFHIKSAREIRGQLLRLLLGGVKSFVGRIPMGNTGGANVHPLEPMEIPADLQEILYRFQGG